MSPDQFATFIKQDAARFAKIVEDAKITPENCAGIHFASFRSDAVGAAAFKGSLLLFGNGEFCDRLAIKVSLFQHVLS